MTQLGHIKDVRIEYGPPGEENVTKAVTFGDNVHSPGKEGKKRKKKKAQSSKVLTIDPSQIESGL